MDIKQLNTSMYNGRAQESVKSNSDAKSDNNTGRVASDKGADKVTLTQNLSQIAELEQQAKNSAPDNSEKIASLKAAIQDGSYQVNAQSVAEKFLQSERLLSQL